MYGCVDLIPNNAGKTAQPKHYICVEKDQPFQISISCEGSTDQKTYGAVLWLDGQKVAGKKTFRQKTMFQGFKLGGGIYKQFIFDVPALASENPLQDKSNLHSSSNNSKFPEDKLLEQKHKGKQGCVIIEFYQTEEFTRQNKPN